MPRKKLSEYRSKIIVHAALSIPYEGWEVTAELSALNGIKAANNRYVVKVDQAVKGRFKRGLVALNVTKSELSKTVGEFAEQGFEHFIVEPYIEHENGQERYISLTNGRSGLTLSYSKLGGIEIESHPESIIHVPVVDAMDWAKLSGETYMSEGRLQSLVAVFQSNHFTFLEINPYIITSDGIKLLDLAVEVDNAGMSFVSQWNQSDIREPKKTLSKEEQAVHKLDKGSVASFNLSVINPEGSIFLLLSGGGASVVIADEIHNQGFGEELANYGEYSGAPTTHEAYKYTSEVLSLLLASHAKKKVLFIGGAVANFTDIATTFAGVIQAFNDRKADLKKHDVTVFVRRGGPRQAIGLENMRRALEELGILGGVYGPSISITDALGAALKGLKK